MRIGFMLLFMLLAGAGPIFAADAIGKAWPLFIVFVAYGIAPLLATRGTHEGADEGPAAR